MFELCGSYVRPDILDFSHLTGKLCSSFRGDLFQVHEVLIQNTDKGSVITWDFDVMKHDVMFSVFRTKETSTEKRTPPPTPTTLGTFNLHTNRLWPDFQV